VRASAATVHRERTARPKNRVIGVITQRNRVRSNTTRRRVGETDRPATDRRTARHTRTSRPIKRIIDRSRRAVRIRASLRVTRARRQRPRIRRRYRLSTPTRYRELVRLRRPAIA